MRAKGAALVVCSYGGSRVANDALPALGDGSVFREAASATLFGAPRIEDVVQSLRGSPILVVPLFMARGVTYGTLKERLSHTGSSDRVVLCPELGSHPRLARRIAEQAAEDIRRLGWRADETSLVLVGHGSLRHEASQRSTGRLAAEIRGLAAFAHSAAAFLEEPPTVEEAVLACPTKCVLAIGCFAEAGRHATRDVPLGLSRSGRSAVYSGPIGARDWIGPLVLDQAMEGLRRSEQPVRARP